MFLNEWPERKSAECDFFHKVLDKQDANNLSDYLKKGRKFVPNVSTFVPFHLFSVYAVYDHILASAITFNIYFQVRSKAD